MSIYSIHFLWISFFNDHKMNRKKGFLLPELMTWVAILVIVSSVFVTVSFQVIKQRQLDVYTHTLCQDLQLLRSTAIATNQDLKIVFYPTENYYQYELEQDSFNVEGKYVRRDFPSNIGYPYYFGIETPIYEDEYGSICTGSVEFGYSGSPVLPRTLWFKHEGTPSAGGHVIITSCPNWRSSVVIVKPVTGRIRIGRVTFTSMSSD